jgi:hypothetical protein
VTRGFGDKLYVSVQNATDVMLDDGEIKVVSYITRVWAVDSTGTKKVLAEGAAFPFPTAFFNDTAAEPGGAAVFRRLLPRPPEQTPGRPRHQQGLADLLAAALTAFGRPAAGARAPAREDGIATTRSRRLVLRRGVATRLS